MKNTTLKLSLALGLLALSGTGLPADKYWDDIQKERNPQIIVKKVEERIEKLQKEITTSAAKEKFPVEEANLRIKEEIKLWTLRRNFLETLLQPSLRKLEPSEISEIFNVVNRNPYTFQQEEKVESLPKPAPSPLQEEKPGRMPTPGTTSVQKTSSLGDSDIPVVYCSDY